MRSVNIALLYRFLLWIIFPVLAIITVAHGIKHHSLRYCLQRFSLFLPCLDKTSLWIHAASVGELNIALNLAHIWKKYHPQDSILISTTTATSGKVFEQKKISNVSHCYLPLDYPLFCRKFLKRVNLSTALIVETEVWLNLYKQCAKYNIFPIIVNARLSENSMRTSIVRRYYKVALQNVYAILARSEQDKLSYARLKPNGILETVGNLKYMPSHSSDQPLRIITPEYIVAASTHDNEESLIADIWKNILGEKPLLVIAPRHIERSNKIVKHLRTKGLIVKRITEVENDDYNCDILIYDLIGHLESLMKYANLVFLGGSLIPKGGHNLLEAARLNIPQVTGPYLSNVKEEADDLLQHKGLLVINNATELKQVFETSIKNKDSYSVVAKNAQDFVEQYSDIGKRYIDKINQLKNTMPD